MNSLSENQQTSVFFNANGIPQQQPSFCVYVDVLGFGEILKNADVAFGHFMENIRPAFRRFANHLIGSDNYLPEWRAKVFSDNVFLVHPFERSIMRSGDGESEFGHIINKIVFFQYECLIHDYPLRGGVSFGKMFIDEESIFGEPLAELVTIEKTTKYPRIALSPSLFPFINTYSSFYANTRSDIFDSFTIDSNGVVFIDYLYSAIQVTEYNFDYDEEMEYGSRSVTVHGYQLDSIRSRAQNLGLTWGVEIVMLEHGCERQNHRRTPRGKRRAQSATQSGARENRRARKEFADVP